MRAWTFAASFVGGMLGVLLLVAPALFVGEAIATRDPIRVFTDGTKGERVCEGDPTRCWTVLTPESLVAYVALALAGGLALVGAALARPRVTRVAGALAAGCALPVVAMNVWPRSPSLSESALGSIVHDPGMVRFVAMNVVLFALVGAALVMASLAFTRPTEG